MEKVAALAVTWWQFEAAIEALYQQIVADGFVPDCVCGISRGGEFPAAAIRMGFPGYIPTTTIQITRDPSVVTRRVFGGWGLAGSSIPITRVLVCEDKLESGESLRVARDHLVKLGKEVKTLSLFRGPETTFEPDYLFQPKAVRAVSFPWERLRERMSPRQV